MTPCIGGQVYFLCILSRHHDELLATHVWAYDEIATGPTVRFLNRATRYKMLNRRHLLRHILHS